MKKITTFIVALCATVFAHAQSWVPSCSKIFSVYPVVIDSVVGGEHVMYMYGRVTDSAYATDTLHTKMYLGFIPNQLLIPGSVEGHVMGSFVDTMQANPGSYYVNISFTDTSGTLDTMLVNIPVVVDDYYVKPSLSVNEGTILNDQHQPVVQITYNTGNTTAQLVSYISYGDTTFNFPTQVPVLSTTLNGQGIYNDTLPYMPDGFLFSIRYTISNSEGDTTSAVIPGQTLGAPSAPTINAFSSIVTTTDSAYLTVVGSTGNLQTKFVCQLYDSVGTVLLKTDTVIVGGQTAQVTVNFTFGGLTPDSYYKAKACALNSYAPLQCQSGQVVVHTKAITPLLSFAQMNQTTASANSSTVSALATLPVAGTNNLYFIWADSTNANYAGASSVPVTNIPTSAGMYTLQVTINSQIVGQTYRGSWYGNDGVTFLNPGDFEMFWTFYGTVGFEELTSSNQIRKNYIVTSQMGKVLYEGPLLERSILPKEQVLIITECDVSGTKCKTYKTQIH